MFTRKKPNGNNLKELPDSRLLQIYKTTEDTAVIGELYKRYTHLVFGLCLKYLKNREDSRDAVMQIFEKLISDLLKHDVTNFKSWLFSVSRNHCLMILRKSNPETALEDRILNKVEHNLVENDELPHQLFEHINSDDLRKALDSLKEEQKVCVELFYLDEKSYKEISDITGYHLDKVKSYIQNAKRNLKIRLSNSDE